MTVKLIMEQPELLLVLDLQTFAGEGDPPPGGGEDPGAGDPPPTGGEVDDKDSKDPVTYSAEQVEAARKSAEVEARKSLYKELGVNSLKELQSKLQEAPDKVVADQQLSKENTSLKTENEDLKTELDFLREAAVHKPEDSSVLFMVVKPLLERDPDTNAVTNVAQVISKLKEEKPFLFKLEQEQPGGNPEGNQKPPQPGGGHPPTSKKGAELGKDLAARFNKKGGK